jgi:hypothetical protein
MGPDEKLVLTMKEMQRIEILRQVEARRLGGHPIRLTPVQPARNP